MACDLSRLDFDLPSVLSVCHYITKSCPLSTTFRQVVKNFSVWKNLSGIIPDFLGFCQVKSSSKKKFFCQGFFKNFLNFFSFLTDRVGLSSIFYIKQQESAFKKKKFPFYYTIFDPPCQAFFAKNFFYF